MNISYHMLAMTTARKEGGEDKNYCMNDSYV